MTRCAFPAAIALGLLGLVIQAALVAAPDGPTAKATTGSAGGLGAAAELKLKDTFGKEFSLGEFKGRIVVLEWLNQGCPVSRGAHEKSRMQDLYRKYADKGVVWIGIDSTRGASGESNRVYAARMGLAYPILLDADGALGHALRATRTPHMFVIGRDGTVAYQGALDDQAERNHVAAAIDDLLANRPVAKPRTDPYGCSIKYAPAG